MPKISVEELHRKVADPTTDRAELAQYFLADEERSGPFDPAVKLNPATVRIPTEPRARARGDMIVAAANSWERLRRRWAFENKLAGGYEGPIIVSEGDSWFQYPLRIQEIIDWLMEDFAIRSLDAAGDTLQNMFNEREYLPEIQATRASVFLFSGGGNDVLGGGNLKEHLRDFDRALKPADHILPSYFQVVDHAMALYDRIFRSVEDAPGDILTICHGYDYALPNNGKWLGRPMIERGIVDLAFQKRIVAVMVDRFNARLKKLADTFPRVAYLDLRGTVGDDPARWSDEIHPTSQGFRDIAGKFKTAIDKAAASRSIADVAEVRRVTRTRGTLSRALRGAEGTPTGDRKVAREIVAPRPRSPGRRGISLHIGLNEIDPAHYGDDGRLIACESDAEAMAEIARSQGFEGRDVLRGGNGTRQALIDGIEAIAKDLKAGDIFLLTYAGHGSQFPDFNKDEPDDDPEGADETLCLYDGMIIDDELYDLWSRFREDVRVLVVSDSCHSGTIIRAPGVEAAMTDPTKPKPRLLPPPVAARAVRRNRPFYSEIARKTQKLNEGLLVKELSFPLRCSVLLLSGCQENQLSLDGPYNGRFTQELLMVWAEGAFEGDYTRFHRLIKRGMPPSQTPNMLAVGRPNSAFLGQRPFSI